RKVAHVLDTMNKQREDALLVAVHTNPHKSRETVDVFAVVSHEVEAVRLAGGDVTLHRLGGGPFLVSGDRSALSRAFSNIIGNALRYRKPARGLGPRKRGMIRGAGDGDRPGRPVPAPRG